MHGAADHTLWHSSVPRGEVPLRVLALQGLLGTPYRGRCPQGVWNLPLGLGGGRWGEGLSAGGCLQCGQEESGLSSPP